MILKNSSVRKGSKKLKPAPKRSPVRSSGSSSASSAVQSAPASSPQFAQRTSSTGQHLKSRSDRQHKGNTIEAGSGTQTRGGVGNPENSKLATPSGAPSASSVYSVVKLSSPSADSADSADSALKTCPSHSTFSIRHSQLSLRPYQRAAFDDRTNGIEVWLWGRQTGKSHTLAAWAVDRLITRLGRLVTILSNSLANGMELNQKCAEIARLCDYEFAQEGIRIGQFETMNVEIRLTIPTPEGEKVSRIKILPANPRTARGFSGDLVLLFLGQDDAMMDDPTHGKRFWTPAEGGGKYRVYEHQVSAKHVDLTVEHYSNTVITSTIGIRKITV